ncbi:wax ester/triacylglycerol synthase domain-containing protein [Kitasatospora sp. McL0602]|uniref:wax ester/triacylglycerol synthase domain-containing protein n=1 Tax=Kitasatospora sp. McL0602 TaxID=3439530 RepID=UPI003F8A4C89
MTPVMKSESSTGSATSPAAESAAAPPALSVQDRIVLELARRGPDPAMHLGLVLLLDGEPPSLGRLAEELAPRLANLPELTFRLGGSARRPRWEPDPAFDLARHLHELPGQPAIDGGDGTDGGGRDAVLTALLDLPLHRDRPLWGIWLVRRPGGFALCYRAHHAFQDGLAAVETVERLFGPPARQKQPRSSAAAEPDRPPRWNADLLRELLPPVRRTARWSALASPPSGERAAYTADVDLARLHRISRATRANVNQICLAVLAAALRAWHPADWSAPGPGLCATLAVSVRAADHPYRLLGNCSGVARVPLPCPEASPLGRLRLLQEQVTFARFAELGRRHRVLYQRMPYWCGSLSLSRSIDPRFTPLTLADVRLRRELEFAGAPVGAVLPLPVSVPGQPLFVAWTTHRRRLYTTFLADAGVPGAGALPGLWEQELDALAAEAEAARIPGPRQ